MKDYQVVPTLLELIERLKMHDSTIGLYVKHTKSDQYYDLVFTNGTLKIGVTTLDNYRRSNGHIEMNVLEKLIETFDRQ